MSYISPSILLPYIFSLSGVQEKGVLTWDQLSQNQLSVNQLPTDQLPSRSTPIKSTSHEITNEQVHYCSITEVQFGVSLKLNTLQDHFHHFKSMDVSLLSRWLGCTSSNYSNLISVGACSLLMTSTISKYLGVVCPQFASTASASLQRDCSQPIVIVVVPLPLIQVLSKFVTKSSMLSNSVELLAILFEQNWGEQNRLIVYMHVELKGNPNESFEEIYWPL